MMLFGPILLALIPVVIILAITRWLSEKEFPLLIVFLPGIVSIMVAINIFYSGFVNLRGFVGIFYGIFALFLIMTGFKSLFMGKDISQHGYI